MARKAKPESHANHERWLVSYADFITLMFAFFVVMFASSQADKNRAKQVSDSVRDALDNGAVAKMLGKGGRGGAGRGGGTANQPPDPNTLKDLKASLEYLQSELSNEIAAGKLQLRLDPRGLVVSLTEAAFFSSGEDAISTAGYTSIDKIAVVLNKLPNPVRLEGHTDSIPIHNSRFRSNWELSAARAIAMLELLSTRCQVPASKLAVAGYADTSPVDTNETDTGRAHNRRVDIVILNRAGNANEPVQPAAAESKPPAQPPAGKPAVPTQPAAAPVKTMPAQTQPAAGAAKTPAAHKAAG